MYSQKFKDWARSKGLYREFDGFNSEAGNLPLFWEAWQAAENAERERICSAIKEAADKSMDGDYMMDSNDCIGVIRGTWNPDA